MLKDNVKLRQFKPDPCWWRIDIWGSGWKVGTGPWENGWKAKPFGWSVKDPPVGAGDVLVGRYGVSGCFSARYISRAWRDGHRRVLDMSKEPVPGKDPYIWIATRVERAVLDVAIYDEPPEVVARKKKQGEYVDCAYHIVDYIPGWGIPCIRLVEEDQRELAKYR